LSTLPHNVLTYTHANVEAGQTWKYLLYTRNRGSFRSDSKNFTTTVGAMPNPPPMPIIRHTTAMRTKALPY